MKARNDEVTKKGFARRLRALIKQKGWNQSDLARAASKFLPGPMGRSNVSVYMRCKSLPTPTQLYALARALDVDEAELLPSITDRRLVSGIDMRTTVDDPSQVVFSIERTISMTKALKILQVLQEDD